MPQGVTDIFQYPARICAMHSIGAVCAEMLALITPLGYSVYAIGAVPHPQDPYPSSFMVTNWPEEWRAAYFDRQFGRRDPTLRALAQTSQTFTVTELRQGRMGFAPTEEELEVLDFAAGLGLPSGLIVPVFRARGYTGVCCLVGNAPEPTPEIRARLQFIAEHTHDRLRALSAAQSVGEVTETLSPRETQILVLARQGLSDAGIAQSAAISVRTVRFHFDNARRKLAARSRAEAIAIAVAQHLLPT